MFRDRKGAIMQIASMGSARRSIFRWLTMSTNSPNLDELLGVVPQGDQRVPRCVAEKLKRSGPLRLL
jgi:hypothetical protein